MKNKLISFKNVGVHDLSHILCFFIYVCMCQQVCSTTGKMHEKQVDSGAGGYLSDGHVSSKSSDNESGSVCSEMVGRELNTAGVFLILLLLLIVFLYQFS